MPEADDICVSYAEDLALIKKAVYSAGKIARDAYEANDSQVWDKSNNSPVTDADIAVNNYLLKTLCEARPGYGWLSEETKDDHSRHACPRTFVVDPIDGTRAFIDRTPNFAVSVAIIQDGKSIAGALYNPLKDEMFEATLGGGAKLNNTPIQSVDCEIIDGIRMVGYARKFRRLGWPDMDCHVVNSMAYRMALVACGQADATVAFTPKSDWDVAAAQLIASEAGAIVTNLNGVAPSYDGKTTSGLGIICAGKTLHALLLTRIRPVIAQFQKSDDKIRDFGFMGTTQTDRVLKDRNMSENMQLLHLVIGGELVDPNKTEFKDLTAVDFVGAYANFAEAHAAWKGAAQRTVDNAHMRYFVLHAHELIDPDKDGIIG
ncbi:inositol monophosphatase family protein [Hellea balneolensis]|uniref:inositol monophosphatase family protein n=1 Tax=Hellea balneolensis TaxID=287478 RepID=UPI0003FE59AE|nr:inositol monophosphatase family protein [Hellea balneolensis]